MTNAAQSGMVGNTRPALANTARQKSGSRASAVQTALVVASLAGVVAASVVTAHTARAADVAASARGTQVRPHAAATSPLLTEFQPNVPTKFGGRVTAIDVNPTDTRQAVAAAESGGLFKTVDGGQHWKHLDGLVPFRMDDVKYSANGSVVIATTQPDADRYNPGGIWRSTDGGRTWSQPTTAASLCGGNSTGYGIAYEAGSSEVYVGMQCGLAYSSDLGASWQMLPAAQLSAQVGPVVAPSATSIDLCTTGGFRRFSRSGGTFTQRVATLVGGFGCDVTHDLAVAPQETSVIFAVAGSGSDHLYESDDNGNTWTAVDSGLAAGTRQSVFVGTHVGPSGGNTFTVIYGASLNGPFKGTCTANHPGSRCTGLNSTRTTIGAAHSDQDQVVFRTDRTGCAEYLGSDGGVQVTTDCGKNFVMAAGSGAMNGGFNALQIYDLAGQTHPGGSTDLYFGTQDNDGYGSTDGGNTWPGHSCCDAYDFSVLHSAPNNTNELVTFDETGGKGQTLASAGIRQDQAWPEPPQTCTPAGKCGYQNPWVLPSGAFLQLVEPASGQPWRFWVGKVTGTAPNAHVTWSGPVTDASGKPFTVPTTVDWRPRIVGPANNPTVFIGQAVDGTNYTILQITGLLSNKAVGKVLNGTGSNQLHALATYGDNFVFTGAFAVDPNNAQRLIAYDKVDRAMKVTTDGGQNWITNAQLTALVGGSGRYCTSCEIEPRAIRFDPTNSNRIMVGTDDAGIIESLDGGVTWAAVPGSTRVTDITDFFFDEVQHDIVVSSYGRGLWKLTTPVQLNPGPGDDRVVSTPTAWWTYQYVDVNFIANTLSNNNARITDLRVVSQSPLLFSVTEVSNTGAYGSAWWWYFGQTMDQVRSLLTTNNARLISAVRYGPGLFAVVMVSNTGANARTWGWCDTDFAGINTCIGSSYRLTNISTYAPDRFVVIFVSNLGGPAWCWYVGISRAGLDNFCGGQSILDISANNDGTFNVVSVAQTGDDQVSDFATGTDLVNYALAPPPDRPLFVTPYVSNGTTRWITSLRHDY